MNTNEKNFSRQQMIFWVLLVTAAATAVLFETEILPKGGVSAESSTRYFIEVAGIFITIGLIPLAMKKFATAISRAKQFDDDIFIATYRRECEIRMMILFVVMMSNIGIYYATDNDSALYCALAGGLAYLFSFPKNKNTEELRKL